MHTHFHFVLVYLPAPPDSEGGLKSRGSTGGIALERAASDRTDISAPVLAALRCAALFGKWPILIRLALAARGRFPALWSRPEGSWQFRRITSTTTT